MASKKKGQKKRGAVVAKKVKLSAKQKQQLADCELYERLGRETREKERQAKEDRPLPTGPRPPTFPKIFIVVPAKDGRWVCGPQEDEDQLRAQVKGDYSSAADATEGAGKKSADVIINTGPPPASRSGTRQATWGRLSSASEHAKAESPTESSTTTEGDEDMAAKKSKAKAKSTKKPATTKKAAGKKPIVSAAAATSTAAKPTTARAGKHADDAKVSWLVKDNPRAKGSETHARFAKYFGVKTVGEYFAKGGTSGDLRWDLAHKYLTVAK